MRPIRARFTTRGMMIAVAATALGIIAVQSAMRWFHYRDEYRANTDLEQLAREDSLCPRLGICSRGAKEQDNLIMFMEVDYAKYCIRLAEHFRKLKEKYALAMSRPWLPVPPDPSMPEWDFWGTTPVGGRSRPIVLQ